LLFYFYDFMILITYLEYFCGILFFFLICLSFVPIMYFVYDLNNNINNKHQSNLAVDGIAFFLFATWQQQFPIACFGCGV